jgi:cytochrome c oxidase subunit 2
MFIDEEDDAIVVELYGQQFYWAARVSGEDNVLGKANVRYIEGHYSWG